MSPSDLPRLVLPAVELLLFTDLRAVSLCLCHLEPWFLTTFVQHKANYTSMQPEAWLSIPVQHEAWLSTPVEPEACLLTYVCQKRSLVLGSHQTIDSNTPSRTLWSIKKTSLIFFYIFWATLNNSSVPCLPDTIDLNNDRSIG